VRGANRSRWIALEDGDPESDGYIVLASEALTYSAAERS
jgi:hypothetical protein